MDALAERITDLWSDERCEWRVEYQEDGWVCFLVWTAEYDNPHGADWAEYTWEFPADSFEAALGAACVWLEQLAPWRRCGACDGQGAWGTPPKFCDDCAGTGLEVSP